MATLLGQRGRRKGDRGTDDNNNVRAHQGRAMRWAMKLPTATPRPLDTMSLRAVPFSSVLLQAAVILVFCDSSTAIRYTNSWAVEVRDGGSKAADALARKYGFENRGQVRLTNDYSFTGIYTVYQACHRLEIWRVSTILFFPCGTTLLGKKASETLSTKSPAWC